MRCNICLGAVLLNTDSGAGFNNGELTISYGLTVSTPNILICRGLPEVMVNLLADGS